MYCYSASRLHRILFELTEIVRFPKLRRNGAVWLHFSLVLYVIMLWSEALTFLRESECKITTSKINGKTF